MHLVSLHLVRLHLVQWLGGRRHPLAAVVAIAATGLVAAGCGSEAAGPAPPMAEVVEVIDGDTVVVRSGSHTESVRMIGIDTPEIAHHGQQAECFGPEAADRTAALLPVGSVVRLERDAEGRDVYGRLLAYVYAADGSLVNLTLAHEGYAEALAISPNLALADAVAEAVAGARASASGLWSLCESAPQ